MVTSAVIDIGTNTLLLLIVDPDGKALVDLCRFGRLGAGLDASGQLAPESIARSLEICREYRAVMDQHRAGAPAIVGTQALREATNAADFVGPAEEILGAPIEVIAGTREAELVWTSVVRTFPELAGTPYLVVDVGGGSTEIITTDGHRMVSAVSLPIGAVRLADRHGHEIHGSSPRGLTQDIDKQLAVLELPRGVPVIGTAGTATTIASVTLGLTVYDSDRVTGVRVPREQLDQLHWKLMGATVEQRRAMPGMEPGRADVIHAGVAIYWCIMKRTEAPFLITCDRGVRWGLAYERLRV